MCNSNLFPFEPRMNHCILSLSSVRLSALQVFINGPLTVPSLISAAGSRPGIPP